MAIKKILHLSATPQAYVMPDEPELTDVEIKALPTAERERYLDRQYSRLLRRAYVGEPEYDTDSLQDAIELEEFERKFGSMDLDDEYEYMASDIEKAATPLIWKGEYQDLLREVPHDAPAVDVDINSDQEAMKLLVVAVAYEVSRWQKPPRSEVTAAAIGLAVALVRKERGVKHPRDIAKEVGVRPQTLFKIRKVALTEIDRLAIAKVLREGGESDGNL